MTNYRPVIFIVSAFILLILCLTFLGGCATSAKTDRMLEVGKTTGDVVVEINGSNNQMNDPGLAGTFNANVPVEGVPVDLAAVVQSQGVKQSLNVHIQEIGGKLSILMNGSSNQNAPSIEVRSGTNTVLIGDLEAQLR